MGGENRVIQRHQLGADLGLGGAAFSAGQRSADLAVNEAAEGRAMKNNPDGSLLR